MATATAKRFFTKEAPIIARTPTVQVLFPRRSSRIVSRSSQTLTPTLISPNPAGWRRASLTLRYFLLALYSGVLLYVSTTLNSQSSDYRMGGMASTQHHCPAGWNSSNVWCSSRIISGIANHDFKSGDHHYPQCWDFHRLIVRFTVHAEGSCEVGIGS